MRGAGVGRAALAAGLGVGVGERGVVDVAGADDAGGLAFAFPGAGGFAAVLWKGKGGLVVVVDG